MPKTKQLRREFDDDQPNLNDAEFLRRERWVEGKECVITTARAEIAHLKHLQTFGDSMKQKRNRLHAKWVARRKEMEFRRADSMMAQYDQVLKQTRELSAAMEREDFEFMIGSGRKLFDDARNRNQPAAEVKDSQLRSLKQQQVALKLLGDHLKFSLGDVLSRAVEQHSAPTKAEIMQQIESKVSHFAADPLPARVQEAEEQAQEEFAEAEEELQQLET